ncbi:MAG: prepilin-type N-terminal cleavage/methylation domain-containing protein [Burkholderiales bacterium]|nr:MAG: prepilin-type N-terminal cleavage/methylation domain-containing protein [Burkholderiales bacterium]
MIMIPQSKLVPFARGVTLVELLITVAVLGVLLAVAVPSLSDLLERRRIGAAANEISDVLHFARAEANSNRGQGVTIEIHPDGTSKLSCVAVTTSSGSNTCRCYETPVCKSEDAFNSELLRVFQLENHRGVSFEAFADWLVEDYRIMVMNRQAITSVARFKVVVTGKRTGAKLHVELNPVGRTRICTPDHSMGGYPACA